MEIFFNEIIENGFLYFFLSTFVGGAILATIITKILFKKSILSKYGIYLAVIALIDAQMSYIVAIYGLVHIFWGLPVALIMFVIFIFLIRKDSLIIKDMVKNLRKMAKYDLNITDKKYTNRKDEFGELSKSMLEVTNNINELLSQIKSNSDVLQQSSQQLSGSSEEISQSTNQQAATVEEISSSIEEMVSTIDITTENLQITEQHANKIRVGINKTQKASLSNKNSMQTISSTIEVINDIAQKTDILAINAAIEAAHAGEHGKGFAVVASEIRKLSENTQSASKKIIELTRQSVDSANITDSTLNEIIPDILKILKQITNIAIASSEQSKTGSQINQSVQEFNSSIQQNSASTEEISTNAESLAQQSENLRQIIEKFNI